MLYITWYLLPGIVFSTLLFFAYILKRSASENLISSNEVSLRLLANMFLWPMSVFVVLREKSLVTLLEPVKPAINFEQSIDNYAQELIQLNNNPLLCGKYVYAHGYDERHYQALKSVFVYDSSQLHTMMLGAIETGNHSLTEHQTSIIKWLSQRKPNINLCSSVPNAWRDFRYIHAKAISNGIGQCYCPQCSTLFDIKSLKKITDSTSRSRMYEVFTCPHNHLLHELKSIHINYGV